MESNFMQVVEPDYIVKLGIQDNSIVSIDWTDAQIKNIEVDFNKIGNIIKNSKFWEPAG